MMTGDAPLRVALAGCGRIGREVFIPLLTSGPGVTLAAVADSDPSAREAIGRAGSPPSVLDDWRRLLDDPRLDAVVIALPSAMHAEAASAFIGRGIATYIEKPMATTIEGARGVLDAHARGTATVMIGFNYRANPLYVALAARLRAGAVGPIRSIRTTFTTSRRHRDGWRASPSTGGGALFDLASHHLDLVRFLSGREIVEVTAMKHADERADGAVLALRLDGHVLATCTVGHGLVDEDRVEVVGELGALSVDRYRSLRPSRRGVEVPGRLTAIREALGALGHVPYLARKLREPWHEPSFRVALGGFVAAARTGAAVSPGPTDGWASLAAVLAAEHSSATGLAQASLPHPPLTSDSPVHA